MRTFAKLFNLTFRFGLSLSLLASSLAHARIPELDAAAELVKGTAAVAEKVAAIPTETAESLAEIPTEVAEKLAEIPTSAGEDSAAPALPLRSGSKSSATDKLLGETHVLQMSLVMLFAVFMHILEDQKHEARLKEDTVDYGAVLENSLTAMAESNELYTGLVGMSASGPAVSILAFWLRNLKARSVLFKLAFGAATTALSLGAFEYFAQLQREATNINLPEYRLNRVERLQTQGLYLRFFVGVMKKAEIVPGDRELFKKLLRNMRVVLYDRPELRKQLWDNTVRLRYLKSEMIILILALTGATMAGAALIGLPGAVIGSILAVLFCVKIPKSITGNLNVAIQKLRSSHHIGNLELNRASVLYYLNNFEKAQRPIGADVSSVLSEYVKNQAYSREWATTALLERYIDLNVAIEEAERDIGWAGIGLKKSKDFGATYVQYENKVITFAELRQLLCGSNETCENDKMNEIENAKAVIASAKATSAEVAEEILKLYFDEISFYGKVTSRSQTLGSALFIAADRDLRLTCAVFQNLRFVFATQTPVLINKLHLDEQNVELAKKPESQLAIVTLLNSMHDHAFKELTFLDGIKITPTYLMSLPPSIRQECVSEAQMTTAALSGGVR